MVTRLKCAKMLLIAYLAWGAGSCSVGVSNDVERSQMDGCYVHGAEPRLALRDGQLYEPQERAPIAGALYHRLRSGAFVLTTPAVLMDQDGSLRPQARASRRFVPIQIETALFSRSRIRLLFPKADGVGFEILNKSTDQAC